LPRQYSTLELPGFRLPREGRWHAMDVGLASEARSTRGFQPLCYLLFAKRKIPFCALCALLRLLSPVLALRLCGRYKKFRSCCPEPWGSFVESAKTKPNLTTQYQQQL
jgi:hypothetical protein